MTFEGPDGVVIGPLTLTLMDTDHLVVCDALGSASDFLGVLFDGKPILSGEVGGSLYGYPVCQPSVSASLVKEIESARGLTAFSMVCRGYGSFAGGASGYIPRSNAGMARNLMSTYFCDAYQTSLFRSLKGSVQQRVLFCRSLCANAKIYAMVEPTLDLSLGDSSIFDKTLTGLASLGTPVIEILSGEAVVHSATVVLDILKSGEVKVEHRG